MSTSTDVAKDLREQLAAANTKIKGFESMNQMLQDHNNMLAKRQRQMETMLRKCINTFIEYAQRHAAKGTEDGVKKSRRNQDMATACLEAIIGTEASWQEKD